jgi:phosphoglucomutase
LAVRDKDAISAVALLCEMAAYEKNKGRSLYQKMIDLYVQYGFYQEHLISITKKGMNGQAEIAAMMQGYRDNTPTVINSSAVVQLLDYQLQKGKNIQTGEEWSIHLPKSNVLQFVLADGSKISARPSGTEPKIKFYFSVNAPLDKAEKFETVHKQLNARIQGIIENMGLK